MKRKKISLQELSVDSFVTNINGDTKQTVKGEALTISDNAVICAMSYAVNICITFDITPAALSIATIVESIIKSNAQANCAGATRTNCNATLVLPCIP